MTVETRRLKSFQSGRFVACRQRAEGSVDVPFPGDQFATLGRHVGERSKAVVFQLEEPILVIKQSVQARQGHVAEAGEWQSAFILAP